MSRNFFYPLDVDIYRIRIIFGEFPLIQSFLGGYDFMLIIEKGKKVLKNKTFLSFFTIALFSLFAISSTYASGWVPTSDPGDPTFISGGVKLVNKVSGWLLLVIPVSCGAIFSYHSWLKGMAEEGGEVATRTKAMKRVLIWGPIAFTANSLVKLVFYYLVNK